MTKLFYFWFITAAAIFSSGCVVMGYSTNQGWFIWPSGFLLAILLLVLWLVRLKGR